MFNFVFYLTLIALIKSGKIITLFIQVTDFFIEGNFFPLLILGVLLKWIKFSFDPNLGKHHMSALKNAKR